MNMYNLDWNWRGCLAGVDCGLLLKSYYIVYDKKAKRFLAFTELYRFSLHVSTIPMELDPQDRFYTILLSCTKWLYYDTSIPFYQFKWFVKTQIESHVNSTHFSQMFHFYIPENVRKPGALCFRTFSGGKEMKHWSIASQQL